MIRTTICCVWVLLAAALPCGSAENQTVRVRENFDLNWRFCLGDATNVERATFTDRAWPKVNVPHDWSIYGSYHQTNSIDPRGGFLPSWW